MSKKSKTILSPQPKAKRQPPSSAKSTKTPKTEKKEHKEEESKQKSDKKVDKTGKWTKEEEEKFVEVVKQYFKGDIKANEMKESIPGRTPRQIDSHFRKKEYIYRKKYGSLKLAKKKLYSDITHSSTHKSQQKEKRNVCCLL